MVLAVSLSVLTGCATVPLRIGENYPARTQQELLERVLGGSQDLIEPVDILESSSGLKAYIDTLVDREWTPRRKLQALRNMLFDEDNLNIQYDNTKTKTAIETFETKLGNCLSMTSLFISAARYVNLDAHYQVVAVKPTWRRSGTTMINNEHINAVGKINKGTSYSIDFLPEELRDEPKAYPISDEEALGRYYSNLGVEHIVNGDLARALAYLRAALTIYPTLADGWNNMGAAQRRLGNQDLSEFSYLQAVTFDASHYTAMSNLARIYKERGEMPKAERYLKRVERFRAKNPYFLYYRAKSAFENRDYPSAERYLKRAIVRKDDEPDFYVALARLYRQTGDLGKSEAAMTKAHKIMDEESDIEDKMEILIHSSTTP